MIDRRDFLKLTAVGGGAVFLSALQGAATAATKDAAKDYEEFFFVQMSDTHWGYAGPANPGAANTLKTAVMTVNTLERKPDFIVFTGDLTHTTDDPGERRRRLLEFREIVDQLEVKNLRFMPGEHDASLDAGTAFKELFGETHYSFDHKGVHFVVLDNVSDPGASLGVSQLQWLKADLAKRKKSVPIVVFTHRPLFDLAPEWDWATRDGARAIEILLPIHTSRFLWPCASGESSPDGTHRASRPCPSSSRCRHRVRSRSARHCPGTRGTNKGLGFREVEAEVREAEYKIVERGREEPAMNKHAAVNWTARAALQELHSSERSRQGARHRSRVEARR
jgi:hypothetical protein